MNTNIKSVAINMDEKKTDALRQHLFGEMYTNVCAVLDGAAIPDLLRMIEEHQPLHVCLLRGVDGHPELAETAPYLVRLEAGAPFTEWVLTGSVGKHWGIFAIAPETTSFIDLRKHFREMLRANLPDGEPVSFRYYDPRVCNTFLPTGAKIQLREFFGPVTQYLAEKISEQQDSLEIMAYSLEMSVLCVKSI
jgi:hypothetical protein